jgi:hypothetical protein
MTRPILRPWTELSPEAQRAFLERVPKSNHPEDFNSPTIKFREDGSGYRDEGLLTHIFSVGKRYIGPPLR